MIIDLQRRIAEVGRIRIGDQVATQSGKTRPRKLETFRLTSPDRQRIDAAAALYGGAVKAWKSPAGAQWEVVTGASSMNVIVPPASMAFSQHYEVWSAGGCQRRCDGVTEQISDGPCLCDPDNRTCTPHTRLSVLLRDLPGLGVWRIDSQGYYAAVELGAAVEIIGVAAGVGAMLPARLRLEQRTVRRPGEPTRDFVVPVLDLDVTPAQLLGAVGAGRVGLAALTDPVVTAPALPSGLTPVPETVPARPVPSIAAQAVVGDGERRPRRGSAQPLPPTGLAPRPIGEIDPPDGSTQPDMADGEVDELAIVLADTPSGSETMAQVEARLRRLYELMEGAGLWRSAGDGTDTLHLALKKYAHAEHVGDLRKEKLVAFAELSWEKAREAVGKLGAGQ